jgi:NAD(P)-dependent dehydrogenase (short-subunit alcohol dehydrogenase family)
MDKGTAALKDLEARNLPGSAELLHLDVTSDETINAAAASVGKDHDKLDILVNNAAVAIIEGPLRRQLNEAFDINATGPAVVGETFLPLLKKSDNARIINISSGVGSIARRLDPASPLYKLKNGTPYRASKTALSMVTACQFAEYEEYGVKVFAYDPGFTVSNLGPHNNVENGARSADESVGPLMDLLEGARDSEQRRLLHNTGSWPW